MNNKEHKYSMILLLGIGLLIFSILDNEAINKTCFMLSSFLIEISLIKLKCYFEFICMTIIFIILFLGLCL